MKTRWQSFNLDQECFSRDRLGPQIRIQSQNENMLLWCRTGVLRFGASSKLDPDACAINSQSNEYVVASVYESSNGLSGVQYSSTTTYSVLCTKVPTGSAGIYIWKLVLGLLYTPCAPPVLRTVRYYTLCTLHRGFVLLCAGREHFSIFYPSLSLVFYIPRKSWLR